MTKKKPEPQYFRTVTDMLTLPAEKIDHFCEDLRLWLRMHKQIEAIQEEIKDEALLKFTTPQDAFGWVDDDKHDARIHIDFSGLGILQNIDDK